MRNPLFKELKIKFMFSLQYLDIALSYIKVFDFRSCTGLKKQVIEE